VEADADLTHMTRRHPKAAKVMSLDTYNCLLEAEYLM
jgi:antitoxin YefM